MEIRETIEIAVPLEKAWELLGDRFCDVHLWRSDVRDCSMVGKTRLLNVPYSGRALETEAGKVEEVLSAYDATQRMLSYRTGDGLPFYVRKLSTLWSVTRTHESGAHVMVIQNFKGVFPFRFLLRLKKAGHLKQLKQQLEDLKRYLETA